MHDGQQLVVKRLEATKVVVDVGGGREQAAGVPGRLLRDFRRTAVRNLERYGVARSVAMKLTGHKTESMYRRYAIVSDADLQEAARKLVAGMNSGIRAGGGVDSAPVTPRQS